MKTCLHWGYLSEFFLEWEIFQIKFVQNPKESLCSVTFLFRKSCRLWNNVEEYGKVRHAAYENTILCMRTAWRILWLQTHTQNMYYLLLLHGNNSYANVPQCYVYKNIACLVDNVLTTTFVYPILMQCREYFHFSILNIVFLKICVNCSENKSTL